MNKIFSTGLIILYIGINWSIAQTADLSSVDEFLKVASTLKEGKVISEKQWKTFDSSSGYVKFAKREDKTLISIIKNSINIAFGNGETAEKDSVLNISQKEIIGNKKNVAKKTYSHKLYRRK